MLTLRFLGVLLAVLAFTLGCGGPSSRLVTVRAGNGSGPVTLDVRNLGDAAVNSMFLASTEAVEAADPDRLDPTSPAGEALWGPDLIVGSAIASGESRRIPVSRAARWNARAVDRDGRQQHVAGLRLEAGGRYVLELTDSGWRMR